MRKISVLLLSLMLMLVFSGPAVSHEVEPEEAGHPLRVAAYVLHPIGYVLYHAIINPAHSLISLPGASQVFGHEGDVSREGSSEGSAHGSPATPRDAETELRLDEVLQRADRPEEKEEQLSPEARERVEQAGSRAKAPVCNFRPRRKPAHD